MSIKACHYIFHYFLFATLSMSRGDTNICFLNGNTVFITQNIIQLML